MKNPIASPDPHQRSGQKADDLTDLEIMLNATIDPGEGKPIGYFIEKYGHILKEEEIEILRMKYEKPATRDSHS